MQSILWAATGTGFTFLMTTLGAAMVFLFRKQLNASIQRIFLGFAAGVMIAASVWSLLIPAMEEAEASGLPGWLPAVGGFVLGIGFLLLLDVLLPHLHVDARQPEGLHSSWRRTTLLVLAVTLHNIPEGMAVGLSFALAAQHAGEGAALSGALALALGIGIQNFPEGAAISLPLRQEGLSAGRAFLYGSASGVVEPVFGILVVLVAGTIQPLMPWLLSFAAGAMMYVVVEELIPEAHLGEHSNTGTLGVMAGFLLMMVLFVHFAVRGRIIAPMQMLEEHFGKISKGDLHTKVSLAEDGTEIGELVAAANRMQDMFSRYIKEVETVLYELSQGNLGQTVSDNFTGDFVKIRESLIAILSSYKASFEEINNAAFEVSNGSEQIAMSSQTLSEGATEQASTIQELTANVNEVSARISETAENAEDVKKAAVEMTEVIQTGNQSLSQLAGTMKELNKYSSDIYKIVKTIDNIAFQTNILALNASVEAARAEQNGASFSVVAEEVRALAAQSAKSAQATAQLIEDTLNAIKTGVETAVSTEELLSAIVGRAENVKHRVIKITEAMESDSVAVQQALASLEQLSSIVQANSANAEETAAASEEISAQASAMMDLVRRFS